MRTEFEGHFPDTASEAVSWKPISTHRALACRVLVVAHTRIEGAWCAYIDAVPGHDHAIEAEEVFRHGTKLPEYLALAIFPRFEGIRYAP